MSPIDVEDNKAPNPAQSAPPACEACGKIIEALGPDPISAFVQVDLSGSGKYQDTIDSRPVLFHQRCFFPDNPRSRRSN
jgi:hypothetical protein